jgi:DNA-binding LacI/PurR family transcriptional regulator
MQVTLREIAEAAGVSRSTASRALHNHPLISEATCKRVWEIAEQHGYKLDPMASSLMRSFRSGGKVKSGTVIGWINEHSDGRYWRKVAYKKNFLEGAEARAKLLGVRIEQFWLAQPGMSGKRAFDILKTRGIRGLIFPTPRHKIEEYGIEWSNFALAILGGRPDTTGFTHVVPDEYANFELLLNHLKSLGHQRLGLVLNEFIDWVTERKIQSRFLLFREQCRPKNRIPILYENESDNHEQRLISWVRKYRPDCIIVYRGETVDWLKKAGFKVPHDLSVASHNVTEDTHNWSGIRTNQRLMGSTAIDAIVAQLSRFEYGPIKEPKKLMVVGRWQDGSTVDNMAVANRNPPS